MLTTSMLVLVLAVLVCASTRRSGRTKSTWFQQLKGWQKLFGGVAVVLTTLILLNPELLALGLLGDEALFDMLVLALSLQLHMFVVRAWRSLAARFRCSLRWLGTPSPGLLYLLAAASLATTSVVSIIQKA